jgi:hypothetical protein
MLAVEEGEGAEGGGSSARKGTTGTCPAVAIRLHEPGAGSEA